MSILYKLPGFNNYNFTILCDKLNYFLNILLDNNFNKLLSNNDLYNIKLLVLQTAYKLESMSVFLYNLTSLEINNINYDINMYENKYNDLCNNILQEDLVTFILTKENKINTLNYIKNFHIYILKLINIMS